MIELSVSLGKKYTNSIDAFINRFPEVIDAQVQRVASEAIGRLKRNMPYKTGHMKQRTNAIKIAPMKWNIRVDTPYAKYLEFGTEDHAPKKERTIEYDRGGKYPGHVKYTAKLMTWRGKGGKWISSLFVQGIKARRFLRKEIPFIHADLFQYVKKAIADMYKAVFEGVEK